MINAKLTKLYDRYCFDVKGHAEQCDADADKICSAASALFCTLLDNLSDLETQNKIINLASNTAKGNSHIEFELNGDTFFDGERELCDAEASGISEGEILLFAFLRGYELLAEKYPSSVSFDEGILN